MKQLNTNIKAEVIQCANERLITDNSFKASKEYPANWFISLFDFLDNEQLAKHLGEEFYQTRFATALMETLGLRAGKNKGIVKLQIIAYASICEALLNYAIECFYKDSFGQQFAEVTYAQIKGALSEKTTIKYNNDNVYICKKKSVPASASWTSNPSKAQFAKENGILSEDIADRYCGLYELRNNAHLLKAANASYFPKPKEAKEAYQLVYQFINEIKNCFINNNKVKSKKENEIDAATN